MEERVVAGKSKQGNAGKIEKLSVLEELIDEDTNVGSVEGDEVASKPLSSSSAVTGSEPVSSSATAAPSRPIRLESTVSSSLAAIPEQTALTLVSEPILQSSTIAVPASVLAVVTATKPDNVKPELETIDIPLPKINTICDPFTCEKITADNTLSYLEKRIRDERAKQLQNKIEKYKVISDFGSLTRLQLLINCLNEESVSDALLECKDESGQAKSTSLFESYWDIAIAISSGIKKDGKVIFEKKANKYLFDGKVEKIESYDELLESQMFGIRKITDYLRKRKVQTSSSGGASDITVIYKKTARPNKSSHCATQKHSEDPCSKEELEDQDEPDNELIMCSSKLFGKEKNVDQYDIQNIWTAAASLEGEKKVVLLVRDSDHVSQRLNDAVRKYLSGKVSVTLGWNDCLRELSIIHSDVQRRKKEQGIEHVDETNVAQLCLLDVDKKTNRVLSLLFHQKMAVDFVVDGIKTKKNPPRYLIGILPRGGKTYIAGGIVRDLRPHRVLVVLGAKTETQSQFIGELFDANSTLGFVDFADYIVHDVLTFKGIMLPEQKYIFICSTENLKLKRTKTKTDEVAYNLISTLFKEKLDLIIVDEAHQKLLTKRGERAFKSDEEEVHVDVDSELVIPADKVPTVFMTGTYSKFLGNNASNEFYVPQQNMILWDYEDVQDAKTLEDPDVQEKFKRQFPLFEKTLDYFLHTRMSTIQDITKEYKKFPTLHLLSTEYTEAVKATVQEGRGMPSITQSQYGKAGFNYRETEPGSWWKGLAHDGEMARIINYMGPSQRQIPDLDGTAILPVESVMDRIDRIGVRVDDRLANITSTFKPHTQLWFLAKSTQGQSIEARMPAIASLILKHPWFHKNFDVMCVSQAIDWTKFVDGSREDKYISIKNAEGHKSRIIFACPGEKSSLKECICKYESKARNKGKGLVILAEGMLKLGISLPCVDIVALMDESSGMDDRIQKMYRCLTQAPYKTAGYIVDLDVRRTVSALVGYEIKRLQHIRGAIAEETIDREILPRILNTYQLDDDLPIFTSNHEEGTRIAELRKLYNPSIFTSGSLREAARLLNQDIDEQLDVYVDGFNDKLGHLEEPKNKKPDPLRKLESGVPVAPEEVDEEGGRGESAIPAEVAVASPPAMRNKEFMEKIQKDIIKTVLKFGAFGTEFKTERDLVTAIRDNKELQDELSEILHRRGLITTSEDPLIMAELVVPLLEKQSISHKQGELYSIMRTRINSANDSKVGDVLDYITEHLAPKDTERHKYGEVFTPLTLVDEMLSKLPQTGADSVWTKSDWKWLDPANGIGNFPIKAMVGQHEGEHTYPGLMNGLEKAIPDPAKRCKHIVENMLYMVDINGKNNAIAKRLFEKLCPGAKANIEKIDAKEGFLTSKPLLFNGKEVKEFDVVMGNPPYNPPKTETGSSGNSIWQNFVIKSHSILNDKGYLLFVHPPGWKKPTDEVFNPEKFADGDYTGQIRQGQVWQVLKDSGVFKFIYTNDQKSKAVGEDYLPHFPAVDYYVYLKGGEKSGCDTKNVFLGKIEEPKGVRLNYNLKYLPNLITKQSQDILHKITSKEGDKPNFTRFRSGSGFSLNSSKGKYKYIYTYNKKGEANYQYSDSIGDNNVNLDKVIMNFGGGIDSLTIQYFKKEDQVGSYDKTMYSKVDSDKEGKQVEAFFKSDIVKFIFLITQYASGAITQNEPLVANSITIPPEGTTDYYKFFGIEEHKKYIEEILAHYEKFKAPRRLDRTVRAKAGDPSCPPDKERNPVTRRCTKKCIAPSTYDEKGRCVKPPTAKSKRAPKRKGGGHKTRRARRQIV